MLKVAIYTLVFLTIVSSGCEEKKEDCVGTPKPDCMCTMQYDPVCGCDNKTYGNACEAECNGIKKYTKGPCK